MKKLKHLRVLAIIMLQLFYLVNVKAQSSILFKVGMDFTNAEIENDESLVNNYFSISKPINNSYSFELGFEDRVSDRISLCLLISSTKKQMDLDTEYSTTITDLPDLNNLNYTYYTFSGMVNYNFGNWLSLGAGPYLGIIHQSEVTISGGWIPREEIDAKFDRQEIGYRLNTTFKFRGIRMEIGYRTVRHISNSIASKGITNQSYSLKPTRSFFISVGYSLSLKKK